MVGFPTNPVNGKLFAKINKKTNLVSAFWKIGPLKKEAYLWLLLDCTIF